MKLTYEQQEIFDLVASALDPKILSIADEVFADAKAGSGKSTLAAYIVEQLKPSAYLYTAFNKKIVEDGVSKFGDNHSKTFHAFAFKYTSKPKIGGFYPNSIKESIPYKDKKVVVDTLNKFCLSKYTDVHDFFEEEETTEDTQELVIKYLTLMADRKIYHTFDYMLKEVHMLLVSGDLKIKYDLLIIDEAQDLTPVVLALFDLIKTKCTLYLGDTSQDIYSFLDLVSAFDETDVIHNLTTSFRLSPEIAKRIERFAKQHIDRGFVIIGVNTDTPDNTEAFITHSNAEIISHTHDRQSRGLQSSYTKGIKEIFEVAIQVQQVLDWTKPKNPKYWKLFDLVKKKVNTKSMIDSEELDDDIRNSIKLITKFKAKGIKVQDVLDRAIDDKANYDYLIGTAHSCKGLEMSKVTISKGLNEYVRKCVDADEDAKAISGANTLQVSEERLEACKLYYVACSRAKHNLVNAQLL